MSAQSPKYVTALAVARSPALDLDAKPERWKAGRPFDALDLRPGRVILFGAPPATGKTTLAGQVVADVLTHQPNLRAVVGNVEMSPAALVEKLLARFAGVPLDALQNRELLADERARVERARSDRAALLDRIAFLDPPFTLAHLGGAMVDFRARLAVVDYAQRFATGDGDDRANLDRLMSAARKLAVAGACVLLVSSVARQKSSNGSNTYTGLNLASFRGSSEIEFGADAAYILDADVKAGVAVLRCEKDRFRQPRDIPLRFDAARQTFTAGDPLDAYDTAAEPRKGKK
jgi:replicative DNA helicase